MRFLSPDKLDWFKKLKARDVSGVVVFGDVKGNIVQHPQSDIVRGNNAGSLITKNTVPGGEHMVTIIGDPKIISQLFEKQATPSLHDFLKLSSLILAIILSLLGIIFGIKQII